MKKTKIYVCGNPLLPDDNLPIKLILPLSKKFPQIKFVQSDPNENLKPVNGQLIIIDTVVGINKILIIKDSNTIQLEPKYSAHDYDLGTHLKLLHKLGLLKNLILFGVPQNIKKPAALKELTLKIKKYLNEIKAN